MKRLFVAIKIQPSEKLLRIYYQLLQKFQEDKINWVKPENLHITLKFLGETAESRIGDINRVLNKVAVNHREFTFSLYDIGIFGSSYNPRVLFIRAGDQQALTHLGHDVLSSFESIGYIKDRQNFVPHLTIGRIKKISHKPSFQNRINQFKGQSFQLVHVDKIFLYESKLNPSGVEYFIQSEYQLK